MEVNKAKPVLVIYLPNSVDAYGILRTNENMDRNTDLKKDYHILVCSNTQDEIKIECFNDCKGLKDADIENLIKSMHK